MYEIHVPEKTYVTGDSNVANFPVVPNTVLHFAVTTVWLAIASPDGAAPGAVTHLPIIDMLCLLIIVWRTFFIQRLSERYHRSLATLDRHSRGGDTC